MAADLHQQIAQVAVQAAADTEGACVPHVDATLSTELAAARETIRRLNRRCQLAEAALATKVDDFMKRGTPALRNYYYARNQELEAEVDRLTRTWKPIETAPRDEELFFWVIAKSREEAYVDTSGHSIFSVHAPRLHRGKYGTWNSLEKATHWVRPPAPPEPPGFTRVGETFSRPWREATEEERKRCR